MVEDGLTPKKRRFVVAMLGATTMTAAAAAVGITERTARRYMADPNVKRALTAALDEATRQAATLAASAMADALDTLTTIHRDADAPTGSRVSAARAILETGPKLRGAADMGERIASLEEWRVLNGADE